MRSILRDRPLLGDALLGAFVRALGAQDLSPITTRGYLHDLGKFRAWLEGEAGAKPCDLRRVTAVDLVNYRQNLLRTERLQAATINRKLQAIKKLFGWALAQGLVKANVAREVRFVRMAARPCPNGLTEIEVQSLLRAAGQTRHGLAKRNYALIELLLETGLRVGEAADLHIGDVDLHDRSGVVRVREGKGRKQRQVPLNSSARRALKLYLKGREPLRQEDHLFLSERGGHPLSLRTIQATVSDLARRAKITRFAVSAHSLRHSFARRFLRRHPGKLVELAALLGHESLDTTAVYTRASAEDLAADVEEAEE
jgi:site-specific recombinase XerD